MAERCKMVVDFSSEEFQRKLFEWFDQRGLLTELRAFMRHRMITALYSAESPCVASATRSSTTVSPTLQALLLLIAEFFIQQEYHYTMSVMVAEVPQLASLPKFSKYVSYISDTESIPAKESSFPRYSDGDIKDILEVFGIIPDSESSQHIHRLYNNIGAKESLLACILTALSAISQTNSLQVMKKATISDNSSKPIKETEEFTKWLEEVRLVLLRAQLTSSQLRHVEDLLWSLYSNTFSKVQKEEQEKHNVDLKLYESQLQAKMVHKEEQFQAQAKHLENDLKKKQVHLQQVTFQLRQQHDEVLNRLNRVQKHADEIRRQESDIARREKQLEQKEKLLLKEQAVLAELQQAAASNHREQSDTKALVELGYLQERCAHLEAELKETKTHLQASAFLKVDTGVQATEANVKENPPGHVPIQQDPSSASSISSFSFSAGGSIRKQISDRPKDRNNQVPLLKRVLRRVQQENSELRAHASQQRRRIDELTTRAAQLAEHIASLSSPPAQSPSAAPAPAVAAPGSLPPTPPPLPARHSAWNSRHGASVGAGGDLRQPQASPGTRHSHSVRLQGREWRRRPPKRLLQHSSLTTSLSSDDSPSEEVLRQARSRLRRLEEESEIVDRRYRDLRARQADSLALASSASLLFVPALDVPLNPELDVDPLLSRSAPAALPRRNPLSAFVSRPPGQAVSAFRPSAGLPTTFSTPPQSQFTLPERPAYSTTPLSRTSNLRSQEPIPHRPSVLSRPSERIKNLLTARSYLFKTLASEGVPEAVSQAPDVTGAPESAADTAVSRASQNLQDLRLTGDAAGSKGVAEEVSHHSDALKSQAPSPAAEKPVGTSSPSQRSLQLSRRIEDLRMSLESPPVKLQPIHPPAIPAPAPTDLESTPPPPQRVESLSQEALKPVRVEATLNEVSTLSSSPSLGHSPVVVEAFAPASAPPTPERVKSDIPHPSRVAVESHLPPLLFASTPQQPLRQLARLAPSASISSIEASDQPISVGSDAKSQNEDDDDFW